MNFTGCSDDGIMMILRANLMHRLIFLENATKPQNKQLIYTKMPIEIIRLDEHEPWQQTSYMLIIVEYQDVSNVAGGKK